MMMKSRQKSLPAPPQSHMDVLFKNFDRGLNMMVEKFGFRMKASCDKLESKISRCEKRMKHCFKALVQKTTSDLDCKSLIISVAIYLLFD